MLSARAERYQRRQAARATPTPPPTQSVTDRFMVSEDEEYVDSPATTKFFTYDNVMVMSSTNTAIAWFQQSPHMWVRRAMIATSEPILRVLTNVDATIMAAVTSKIVFWTIYVQLPSGEFKSVGPYALPISFWKAVCLTPSGQFLFCSVGAQRIRVVDVITCATVGDYHLRDITSSIGSLWIRKEENALYVSDLRSLHVARYTPDDMFGLAVLPEHYVPLNTFR